MIRFVLPALEDRFRDTVEAFGVFGTKIYAQSCHYGIESGILDLWLLTEEGRVTGVISRLEGAFTLALGAGVNLEEIGSFLLAAGGCSAEGEQPYLQPLNAVIHGELCSSWILRREAGSGGCPNPPPSAAAPCADGIPVSVERAERLSEVYALHGLATPGFRTSANEGAWLTDASHRQRHGLSDFYILKVENETVSTACILFQGTERALLGAVATRPDVRGRGYGSLLVGHAAAEAQRRGLSAWLFTGEDSLLDFYRPLGFAPQGRWGRIDF